MSDNKIYIPPKGMTEEEFWKLLKRLNQEKKAAWAGQWAKIKEHIIQDAMENLTDEDEGIEE